VRGDGHDEGEAGDGEVLAAGPFSAWVDEVRAALRGGSETDVACGTCTACCTSSQFVHIEPDEAGALAAIPPELLFPAPLMPPGHVLLGYDERGRCPMLGDHGCTIYASRPRTCRTYDCRVFPATGLDLGADEPGKADIARRARRWRFDPPTGDDTVRRRAVEAAAAYLRHHADRLPDGAVPPTTTQLAALAVDVHEAFLSGPEPPADEVLVAITRRGGRRRRT
jgi:hypothetical protein